MSLFGAVDLGQLHGLIDYDPVRHLRMLSEFERGETQYGALDHIDLLDRTIDTRLQQLVKLAQMAGYAMYQFTKIVAFKFARVMFSQELLDDIEHVLPSDLPLVQGLDGMPARPMAFPTHRSERTQEIGHLDRGSSRFATLVSGLGACALDGLLDRIHG